jgi:hypothetical protein
LLSKEGGISISLGSRRGVGEPRGKPNVPHNPVSSDKGCLGSASQREVTGIMSPSHDKPSSGEAFFLYIMKTNINSLPKSGRMKERRDQRQFNYREQGTSSQGLRRCQSTPLNYQNKFITNSTSVLPFCIHCALQLQYDNSQPSARSSHSCISEQGPHALNASSRSSRIGKRAPYRPRPRLSFSLTTNTNNKVNEAHGPMLGHLASRSTSRGY